MLCYFVLSLGTISRLVIEIKLMSFWSHVAVIVVSPSDRIKQRYHVVKHYEKCARKGRILSTDAELRR
jgi:hypothetical protein